MYHRKAKCTEHANLCEAKSHPATCYPTKAIYGEQLDRMLLGQAISGRGKYEIES